MQRLGASCQDVRSFARSFVQRERAKRTGGRADKESKVSWPRSVGRNDGSPLTDQMQAKSLSGFESSVLYCISQNPKENDLPSLFLLATDDRPTDRPTG